MEEKKRESVYNPEADARWIEENRERKRYLSARSAARSFINTKATLDDLDELQTLIVAKIVKLNAGSSDRKKCLKNIKNERGN